MRKLFTAFTHYIRKKLHIMYLTGFWIRLSIPIQYKHISNLINPLSANAMKWSNTLNLPMNCLSVLDHFVWLALKGSKTRKFEINKFRKFNSKFSRAKTTFLVYQPNTKVEKHWTFESFLHVWRFLTSSEPLILDFLASRLI